MKKTLYIITLEPLEQRYTKQWYYYWKSIFRDNFNVKYVDGIYISDKIKKGRFLDIYQTNMWKATQVEILASFFNNSKIKEDDIFLFMDGWHFGITALKYMLQLSEMKNKIYAYWHAGTWDDWDFISQAGLREWATLNEAGWFQACDGHFVATQFHKNLINKYFTFPNRMLMKDKIHVVGFPMNWSGIIEKEISSHMKKSQKKKNLIVFPHRLDKEKQPEVFDKLRIGNSKYKFVKTLEETKNKKEYYELLCNAKVAFSASLQETFGIGTVEAMMLNALPLVPDRLSYSELYEPIFKYKDLSEAKKKLKYFVENYDNPELQKALMKNKVKIRKASLEAIEKMSRVILNE